MNRFFLLIFILTTLGKLNGQVPAGWTNLKTALPDGQFDIRYATTNNFMKKKVYDCAGCYLRKEVADALLRAAEEFRKLGFGIKFFDCYRPKPFQQRLWDVVPDQRYVAPPARGSMHSRGSAIDLTLYDLKTGKELNMGTEFDFFGKEAYPSYKNHSPEILNNRKIMQTVLTKQGFGVSTTEWWHFSYKRNKAALADWIWPCQTN